MPPRQPRRSATCPFIAGMALCVSAMSRTAPQFNIRFGCALRMVGHDMKVSGYRDTGIVDFQIPPSWWIDN